MNPTPEQILQYPGRNEIEQAQAYLCANVPGFDKRTRQDQIHEAGNLLRTLMSAPRAGGNVRLTDPTTVEIDPSQAPKKGYLDKFKAHLGGLDGQLTKDAFTEDPVVAASHVLAAFGGFLRQAADVANLDPEVKKRLETVLELQQNQAAEMSAIDLRYVAGGNPVQKMQNYLLSDKHFAGRPRLEQIALAGNELRVRRQLGTVIE